MRVLLDTDVVLDLVLLRPGFAQDAIDLMQAHSRGAIKTHISAITPINVSYIARKPLGQTQTRQAVEHLLQALTICSVNATVLQQALSLPMSDFEDATQVACALQAGLDAIVTRNLSDYQASPLPVYSPAQLLAHLNLPTS